ncbi:hypothetical protein [uncultured Bosea sp.]|uniref:hypothetical protein n=1 Tax=uncultured Bosea sp. TaxID=211457 RepID=UPI00263B770E|nr:hypothetical protein [uncultured Bosea sp.]
MPRIFLHEFRGSRYTTSELAEMSGVPAGVLRGRLAQGWNIEQAMTVPTIQQRRRGVVSNLIAIDETGRSSSAQETTNISFSEEANQ